MNSWKLVTRYKALKRYCLFVGTDNGYRIEKVFSTRMFAKMYAIVNNIRFTEGD